MTSKNASVNHDAVHATQLPVQYKMLNLKRLHRHRPDKIWILLEYWTIQGVGVQPSLLG